VLSVCENRQHISLKNCTKIFVDSNKGYIFALVSSEGLARIGFR
jgi:hypothetical protein